MNRSAASAVLARDVLAVSGPDAVSYLDGQMSQDISSIEVGSSAWSFLLEPTGRLGFWLRVSRIADDTFSIDMEPGFAESVAERLRKFLMRIDVGIEVIADMAMLTVRGSESPLPEQSIAMHSNTVAAPVDWRGDSGHDIVGPVAAIDHLSEAADDGGGGLDVIEAIRIAAGTPKLGNELIEGSIPSEAGEMVISSSVSFTKGCYTGQELVARMSSRGATAPRQVRILDAQSTIVNGTVVTLDGKDVGTVTSAGGHQALALLSRRVEPGSSVLAGGTSAVVSALGEDVSRRA